MDLNSEKDRVSEDSPSIRTGLWEQEEEFLKRKEIIERFWSLGRTSGGRSDQKMPSLPSPDFSK